MSNKIIKTSQLLINDTSTNHYYNVNPSELTENIIITLPPLTNNDEFVFKDHEQILDNKIISSSLNTIGANELRTTGASVVIDTSIPPSIGQQLVATSSTSASWQSNGFIHYGSSSTDPVGSPSGGDKYYNTVLNHEMFYDSSRNKWLSVALLFEGSGTNGSTNDGTFFKRFNGLTLSTTIGPYVPKGTIISLSFNNSNSGTIIYEILVGGIVVSELSTSGSSTAYSNTINADFNGGVMSSRNKFGSDTASNSQGVIQYRLRI